MLSTGTTMVYTNTPLPEGLTEIWLTSRPAGTGICIQPVPSGAVAVTPCRTMTRPATVTVHTHSSSPRPPTMSYPPTLQTKKHSF
jgi:hypothetical protein